MLVDPNSASSFIRGYTDLMAAIYASYPEHKKRISVVELVAAARARCAADPLLLDAAVSSLEARGEPVETEVVRAVRDMRLKQWIFLRDTKRYSLFLDPNGQSAYGVLGLTQRVRDIIGGSGVILETAIVRYRGYLICDGVVSKAVWLGPNYRRDFAALFAKVRKNGAFHEAYEPNFS